MLNDPLTTQPTAPPPLSLISTVRVPNELPTESVSYRLAVIGEAPGADEEAYGRPFIGASGRLLDNILSSVGILRAGCFVGNICKYRPPGNDIKAFGLGHEKVLEGWEELKNELVDFSPHCTLALGNTPLYFLCGRSGITSWRGSILATPFGKVVPAIHPAAVLREYKQWFLLRLDALRARQESDFAELILPQRELNCDLSADAICDLLDTWQPERLLSFDIEGGLDSFPCCSVAGSAGSGFIIAWSKFSPGEQERIYRSLSAILYSNVVPKVLQNSLYDRFVLAYGYQMLIRNVVEDTMLKSWEIHPELPKGLGTIASIYTREPHYKFERKTDDPKTFYEYCIKDSCVTLEACNAQDAALTDGARRHYRFNMELLSPLLYMELRGIRYDSATANVELGQCNAALSECSSRLSLKAGYDLCGTKGSISATKLKRCLYSEKGYPEQKQGRGLTAKVTTDVEALLNLSKKFPNDAFLSDILLHRKLESVKETLEITSDPDGRVRCGYNLVGTETGRLTCYTSPTGSGTNLQTITKKLRKLYVADEEMWMFQCDLSGADGWTVAAHCLRHGDSTMWNDYSAGLKPARIIALMYEHGIAATNCSREELKEKCRAVDDDGWLYFGCKRIQHACYTEGHEVLTPNGWLPIKDVIMNQNEVMVYDNQTREMWFEHPSATHSFDYTGYLHTFVGTSLDLEVTHNHKIPYFNVGKGFECTAEELMSRKQARIPIAGYYKGGSVLVPAELIAAFQSDGHQNSRGHVVFHFAKLRKVCRLKGFLSVFNIPYTFCENVDGTYHFSITDHDAIYHITRWGKAITKDFLLWTKDCLKRYVDEYPHWDGYFGPTKSISVSAVDEVHLRWLTTLTTLVGRSFSWQKPQKSGFSDKPCFVTMLNNRNLARVENLDKKEANLVFNVPVYCVTVSTGFLLIRRNGKICVSGNSNYGVQERTVSKQIMVDSYKITGTPVYVDAATCAALQRLYFVRYPGIFQWHAWARREVESGRNLTSASGHTRTFLGRRKSYNYKTRSVEADHETWKEFLADEPQENTTFAIKLALHKLWYDPTNTLDTPIRHPLPNGGELLQWHRVDALHTVHDSINGQFLKSDTAWAIPKIVEAFNNTLHIAGSAVVIPFEGKYGPSWGQLGEKYGGGTI